MSLQLAAQRLAAQGRGGDTTLVHMNPREVAGLQALALRGGTSLTINPQTGLPEALSLKSLLPAALGFALGPAGFGLMSSLGAAATVGGLTALSSGSLSKGLMAGMGAYGGSSLGEGLYGVGAGAAQDAAMSGLGEGASQAARNEAAAAASRDFASRGVMDRLGSGLSASASNPSSLVSSLGGGAKALQAGYMLAGPILADQAVQTTTKAPALDTGYIRPYTGWDPQTLSFRAEDPIKASGVRMAAGGSTGLRNSQQAFDYLMGKTPARTAAPVIVQGFRGPNEITGAGGKYVFDSATGTYKFVADANAPTTTGTTNLNTYNNFGGGDAAPAADANAPGPAGVSTTGGFGTMGTLGNLGQIGLGMVANAVSPSNPNAAPAPVSDVNDATNSSAAQDSASQASDTAATATTGPSGTGASAAGAAAAAASAAAAAGMSAEAQGAASQAAADAAVSGMSAADAAAAGAAAAAAADSSIGMAADANAVDGGFGSVGVGPSGDSAAVGAADAASESSGGDGIGGAGTGVGEGPGASDSSGVGASDGSGVGASDGSGVGAGAGTGGASAGDSGDGGTGAASSAGDSSGDGGGGGGGDGGGGCFLTTAAVEHMGQKDDGEVLSTLRQFRDSYMRKNKEKSKDVAWYYDNAPRIVDALDNAPNGDKLYKKMYKEYIHPAYEAIKDGELEYAYELYKDGIDFAKKASGIDKEQLKPRYGKNGYAAGGIAALAAGGNGNAGGMRSNAFVVPADVVSALGNGSTKAGLTSLNAQLSKMAGGGATLIQGPGDGLSDSIPTKIDGRKPARVADGEAYIDPRVVQRLGGGSVDKGSAKLYKMMDKIRQQAHGKKTQQRPVKADRVLA